LQSCALPISEEFSWKPRSPDPGEWDFHENSSGRHTMGRFCITARRLYQSALEVEPLACGSLRAARHSGIRRILPSLVTLIPRAPRIPRLGSRAALVDLPSS